MVQHGSDIPIKWNAPASPKDYDKREVMIPMRDGIKLHTVILIHHGAHDQPILLERTPYNASGLVADKPHMRDAVFEADREWVDDGYIIVMQDIRGKYGSEGDYVMSRPSIGPLNPTKTDDTTDAYDTVDWLVKNVAESNHKVGMIGSSYDGWTVTMALLGPHPALKVAAPESPMIDGWLGDDWFHYGAFRQFQLDYITKQTSVKGEGDDVPRDGVDDYQIFLDAGSAGAYAEAHGLKQLAWWNRMSAHPAYDAFWQLQALDKKVAQQPSNVPTMWLQGLWDQEDMYGAVHSWAALKAAGHADNNHLVMGPWYHSQINGVARNLGPLEWNGDTATTFRRDVMIPFFNVYLKDKPTAHPLPPVLIYNPSENHWDAFSDWPGTQTPACARFRDLSQIVGSVLQVAFYLTPIMWLPRSLPANVSVYLLDFNPAYHLLEIVRAPLLGQWPSAMNWGVSAALAVVGWALALFIYGRYKRRIAYWL
ncbi:putative hydrolase, CocE/NonD family [Dyella jiangningensis]|nr:putative CocE/NonD family hydrolase [Dyella sp. AtDHG13]SDL31883.1 putative hydrolase, CocE/NonD family [Dyella jiangningensis]